MNSGTALESVLEAFEDDDTSTLAHDEAVAALVEGT